MMMGQTSERDVKLPNLLYDSREVTFLATTPTPSHSVKMKLDSSFFKKINHITCARLRQNNRKTRRRLIYKEIFRNIWLMKKMGKEKENERTKEIPRVVQS